jgi:hypothetical protein
MSEEKPIITIDPIIRGKIAADYLMQTANPAIPVTFVRQNIMSGKPKFIIIHDSSCLNHSNSALLIDGPASAIGALKVENIVKSNYNDYNYHFIVDRIDKDYEVITGRPMSMRCDFPDLDKKYQNAIHVIILCDLSVELPSNRLYKILAYRCLAPLIKSLRIGSDPSGIILFHKDITNKDISCPGDFLAREILISQVKRFL